jgi:amidase
VEQTARQAIEVLAGAGARVTEVSVPLHRAAPLAIAPLFLEGARRLHDTNYADSFGVGFRPASFMAAFGRAKASHSHELPLNLKLMLLAGRYAHERGDGRLYAKAEAVRPTIAAQYRAALAEVDVLAMPTVAIKSHPYKNPGDFVEAIERTLFGGQLGEDLGVLIANTAPFNYTGFPAVSIPCGKSAGMPVGLQLVAPHFREDVLIRTAHAFQRSVDWRSFFP